MLRMDEERKGAGATETDQLPQRHEVDAQRRAERGIEPSPRDAGLRQRSVRPREEHGHEGVVRMRLVPRTG